MGSVFRITRYLVFGIGCLLFDNHSFFIAHTSHRAIPIKNIFTSFHSPQWISLRPHGRSLYLSFWAYNIEYSILFGFPSFGFVPCMNPKILYKKGSALARHYLYSTPALQSLLIHFTSSFPCQLAAVNLYSFFLLIRSFAGALGSDSSWDLQ